MSKSVSKDPWTIDSDNEDEKQLPTRPQTATIRAPFTSRVVANPVQPRIPDWSVTSNDPEALVRALSSSSDGSAEPNQHTDELSSPIITTEALPPVSPTIVNTSNYDPIALLQDDLIKFVTTPVPKDYPFFVQCRVKRDKDGMHRGFFPTFYLHVERLIDGKKFFALAARKVAKVNRQSDYLITTNVETLSEKGGGDGLVGRLRGTNLVGTEYVLYDNGLSPNKSASKHSTTRENIRKELGAIVYNTNILGFKGPRQISAMLPEIGHDIQPIRDEPGIVHHWKHRRLSYLIQLRNRTPKYNEETKTYVLQFTGNRVAQPSVKNFQMVIEHENHEEVVVMQFGRVDDDIFTCDFRYPLTAVQAFGIALSSFDSRLVRE